MVAKNVIETINILLICFCIHITYFLISYVCVWYCIALYYVWEAFSDLFSDNAATYVCVTIEVCT